MKATFFPLLVLMCTSHWLAAISIQTTTVPNGIVKDPYLGVITATGGCTPYKWQVTSGSLPAGVTMKISSTTTSVKLSGTPSKSASYSFIVSTTGCGGGVAKASYKVVIQPNADHVVDLRWSNSSSTDVAGYNIYRGPDGKSWAKVNGSLTASGTYADSTVADSSTYYYSATAVDIYGRESRKSNIAKSIIP